MARAPDETRLVLINGASGVGKTTLAQALATRAEGVSWVHPDGLMDTPNMQPEEILDSSLRWARSQPVQPTVVIDCQIRPTAIDDVLQRHSIESCEAILLCCPRAVREQRLRDRGWQSDGFARIDAWARLLRAEAEAVGHKVLDTSSATVEAMLRELPDYVGALRALP